MSQIFQPQPLTNLPRPNFNIDLPGAPQVGIENPSMPGAVVAVDTSAGQLAGAISHVVGSTADLFNARAARDERAAVIAERNAAKAEKDQEKATEIQRTGIMRGIASSVREGLPGDLDAIKKGVLRPTDDDQNDPEIWLDNLARGRMADVPEQFREEAVDYYKRLWAPRGLGAIYAKADDDRKRNEQATLAAFGDEITLMGGNNDLEGLDLALRRGLEAPGADAEKVRDRAATSMLTLAKDGQTNAVAAIKSWLGDGFQKEQITADDLLERFADRAAREQGRLFANDAADIRSRVTATTLTLEGGIREIKQAAKDRGIESRFVENEVQGLEAAIRKRDADQASRDRAAAISQIKATVATSLATQAVGGFRPTFEDRVVGIDENGKPITYSESDLRRDTLAGIRGLSGWPAMQDGTPDPLGWSKMNGEQKSKHLKGLEKTPIIDPYLLSAAQGMDLRSEDQTTPTAMDVRAIDTVRQIRSVSPVYAQRLIAAGGIEAKYAHLASILLDANPDTHAAITRTKQIYKTVGDRIERVEPSQLGDILDAEPSLKGNIPALQAAAAEAGIRIFGKPGDSAQMRRKAAEEAVESMRPFLIEVNGRPVQAGSLASQREIDREVAGEVMAELLTGRVNEFSKADASRSGDIDDYTLEMVNAELYRVVYWPDPTMQAPRNTDSLIRVSQIEDMVTARMKSNLASPVRAVAELERLISEANAANARTREINTSAAMEIDFDRRTPTPGGLGALRPMIDTVALQRELNVARLIERQKKK